MGKKEEVPFNYVTTKLSYDCKKIIRYLYLIYGSLSLVFIYKILKGYNKI